MPDSINVKKALEEAEKLVAALKTFDQSSPTEHLALIKQTDKKLPAGSSSIRATDLALAVNVNVSIITRMMRVIISGGIAIETAPDEYAHNLLSQAGQLQAMGSFFFVCMDFMKTWVKLPEYFKSHKPQDLFDLKISPFAFAAGKEGLTYYEVLNLDIDRRDIWNKTLQQMDKNMPILGMFPFATLKEEVERQSERPFIVDVGCGRGQPLLAISTECSQAFGGKLILQDLPIVISSLKPEEIPGIEPMVYDIFTPQPVKSKYCFSIFVFPFQAFSSERGETNFNFVDAHIYFMRRLLHDFYNPVRIEILKNTVSAM